MQRRRLKSSLRDAFLGQSIHGTSGRAISTTFSDQKIAIVASPQGVPHSVQCPLSFLSAVARRIREDLTTPCFLLPMSAGPFWARIMYHVNTLLQPPGAVSWICVRVRHALCKPSSLCVCRGRAAGLLSNVLLNTWHMQGRNSQRELRKQLSEKCASTVQNLVKVAGTVREQSGSEVRLADLAFGSRCLLPARQQRPFNIPRVRPGCSRGSPQICSKGEIHCPLPAGRVLHGVQADCLPVPSALRKSACETYLSHAGC